MTIDLQEVEAFLPQRELRVLAVLRSVRRSGLEREELIEEVAESAGVSSKTAWRAMRLLEVLGLWECEDE